MSRIRVEEAPAVCTQHLDRFLRRNGTLGDHLLGPLDCFRNRIRVEILNDTLRTKKKRSDEGNGNKDVQSRACQVDPKIAYTVHLLACEAARDSDCNGYTGCGGGEILYGQRCHLHKVTER